MCMFESHSLIAKNIYSKCYSECSYNHLPLSLTLIPPQYLSTPESLLIIPELIRFVCCVIHPPNEILQSDIVPRWAFIGWLLSLCQVLY